MRYATFNALTVNSRWACYSGERVIVVSEASKTDDIALYNIRFDDGTEIVAAEKELVFQEGLVKSCGHSRCATPADSLTRSANAVLQHKALVSDVAMDVVDILRPALSSCHDLQYALLQAIIVHDDDKLHGEMLYQYAKYFYPVVGTDIDEEEYRYWRARHRVSNQHHGDYWVALAERNDAALPVTRDGLLATLEMACDWEATSESLGHSGFAYFNQEERDFVGLPPKLYFLLESLLEVLEYRRLASGKLKGMQIYSVPNPASPREQTDEAADKLEENAVYFFKSALERIGLQV